MQYRNEAEIRGEQTVLQNLLCFDGLQISHFLMNCGPKKIP